jgi:hypothetical protein
MTTLQTYRTQRALQLVRLNDLAAKHEEEFNQEAKTLIAHVQRHLAKEIS